MDRRNKYNDNKGNTGGRGAEREGRFRNEEKERGDTLVIGRNAVIELLKSGRDVNKIYVRRGEMTGSLTVIMAEAANRKIPVSEVETAKLDKMSGGAAHQGVIASAAVKNYSTVDDILSLADERGEKPLILMLDGVEDPQNLGALIRSAECTGAHGVIIPKHGAVGLTFSVGKASAGAVEYVPVAMVANLARTVDELKERGLWIFAAEAGGEDVYSADFDCPAVLILGSEGFGVSRLLRDKSDFTVSIPMYGNINSMNVTAAGAVILCEAAKQRHTKSDGSTSNG
ncbi:MAG: 23S rRNA (guanosine(2251)-2'-O)-methyltransferase RlmB [Clostridia bacterium]|nr:23S rRNA (guanosine(2251)-2'-O)-methyltransferase RlmB [Clostridia bacterium]